jgi:hypothetical protein
MVVFYRKSENRIHFQKCDFFQRERIENTKLFFGSGKEYCDCLTVKALFLCNLRRIMNVFL